MLSDEQKRLIEMQAAQQIRDSWGGLDGARVRGVIDDVRSKLVEEAWFGHPTTDRLNDFTYTSHAANSDLMGRIVEAARSAWEAVFGRADADIARAQEERQQQELAPQRRLDGPEIGG